MYKTGLIVIILFLTQVAQSQDYLVLKKRNKLISYFGEGDYIRIKIKGESFLYKDMILGFSEDMILFRFNKIALAEIEEIYLTDASGKAFGLFSQISITAGILFFGLDMANQILFEGIVEPTKPTLIITGGLIATGMLLKVFRKKKYNVKNFRYRLSITNFIDQ